MKLFLILFLLCATACAQSVFPDGVITPAVQQTAFDGDKRLSSFTRRQTVGTIPVVASGISGASYIPTRQRLFIIRNASGTSSHFYEMDLNGSVIIRTITEDATAGQWVDTEAMKWIGWDSVNNCDVVLIAEEENPTASAEGRLSLCRLTTGATTISRTGTGNVSTTTAYSNGTISNAGLEAVCYDPAAGKIYYTSEMRTQLGSDNTAYASGAGQWRIFQRPISWVSGTYSFGAETVLCSIIGLQTTVLTDISDMEFDRTTNTILLHSDESDKVVRIDKSGTVLEQLAVPMGQGEGVAIHPDGTELYLSGEPQEFQRWSSGVHRGIPALGLRTGLATLAAGVVTVSDTTVTANTRIFVTRVTDGGTPADSYSLTRTAGTSFTITSKLDGANHVTDTSVVSYLLIEP